MFRITFHTFVVLILAALAAPVEAQQVLGVLATQAVLHYQAPSQAACEVQVSTSPSFSPLAADVNPALFAGANLDTRAGNLISASGADRYFVVGKKRADLASDGKRYSRALQAFTEYFFQITCESSIQSGRFVTANPPLGNNFPEPPPFDATAFGNYAWPTIDWNDQSKTYIDPMTGVLLKRATAPGWYGASQTGKLFAFATDLKGAWTNVSNIVSGTNSSKASYSGVGDDPVFLAFDPARLEANNGEIGFSGWVPSKQTLDNILVRIFGTGTGTISGCLSDDSGAHCISPAVDLVTLSGSGGNPAGTYPTLCASETATGCFPNSGFWTGWNFTPVRGQMGGVVGTVNVAGSAITAAGNTLFDLNWKPGGKVSIAGSAPACPGDLCTIALVNTSTSMTILEVLGNLNDAAFKSANSGIMLWVKKSGGAYSASISANFDYSYSDQAGLESNGTWAQCSPVPTTVSWAADGVTPITPVPGQMCLGKHRYGTEYYFYLLIPSSGETRFIAPLFFSNPNDPAADQVQTITAIGAGFDTTDPNTVYVQGTNAGGRIAIYRGVYDAAVYRYRTYRHVLYPSQATGNYFVGQDTTKFWFPAVPWGDMGITWTDMTKSSQQRDLQSQVANNPNSNYDSAFFSRPVISKIASGRAFTSSPPFSGGEAAQPIQSFDLATGNLIQSTTSYSTFPARWCAIHANLVVEGWYGLMCNPVGGAGGLAPNPNVLANGPWQMTPTAVLKNGTFSSDTSMTATSPLDVCPPIPANMLALLPANPACVTFRSQMACSHTPYAGENIKWPCEHNPAWSEIQPIAPGDGILIVFPGVHRTETLMIVKVTSLGNTNYEFVAVRGTTPQKYKDTPNGWTGYAVPPTTDCDVAQSCTPGVGMWFKATDPDVTWRLEPDAFGGHSDLGPGPTPGASTYCITTACRYNTPMEQQIGISMSAAYQIRDGSFAGVGGSVAMQGYPSLHQFNAPPSERVWMTNFRHLNPSFGSGLEVAAGVGAVNYSLVPGTRGVLKFTAINGGLSYKQVPPVAYAGYHLLQENSSPAKGNIITDATPWKFCVALTADECQSGSKAGEVYMSVPSVNTSSQNCISNWYADNFPCVYTPPAQAGFAIQQGVSRPDPNGTNWRRITMGFSGPGRQYQFGSLIPDPTGTWGFLQGYWLDGARNDLLIAKLPPWPNPQDVTTNRSDFIPQVVRVSGNANLTNARVRFGYGENGTPGSFYCTPRQETCVAAGNPYSFVSESQGWQSCTGGCTISVPAIPGRALFYAVDRQDGAGNTIPGDPQAIVVR